MGGSDARVWKLLGSADKPTLCSAGHLLCQQHRQQYCNSRRLKRSPPRPNSLLRSHRRPAAAVWRVYPALRFCRALSERTLEHRRWYYNRQEHSHQIRHCIAASIPASSRLDVSFFLLQASARRLFCLPSLPATSSHFKRTRLFCVKGSCVAFAQRSHTTFLLKNERYVMHSANAHG